MRPWMMVGIVLAGCSSGNGAFQDRCELACAPLADEAACTQENEACIDDCLVRTQGVSTACGNCVADNSRVDSSSPVPADSDADADADQDECNESYSIASPSDPECVVFCAE